MIRTGSVRIVTLERICHVKSPIMQRTVSAKIRHLKADFRSLLNRL